MENDNRKKSVLSLKEYLLTDTHAVQYQGKGCDEVFPGQIGSNAYGQCYPVVTRIKAMATQFMNHYEQ